MNEQDWKNLWQESATDLHVHYHADQLEAELNQRLDKVSQQVNRRNRRETLAAIAVGMVAVPLSLIMPELLARIGFAWMALYALGVLYVIRKVKQTQPDTDLEMDQQTYLTSHIHYLKLERKMLRNVLWWYLAPAWVAATLVFMGVSSTWQEWVGFQVFILAMYGWILRMNLKAAKDTFDPLIQDLEAQLSQFSTHEA
ncbi:hypothetical protein [Pontibacter sp. G13]|uniref:hypothetical protein n=1 Tax=Pontibacter sp. G13 TaxID=3074898 RepID=UPI00288BFC87|nr:hypothetical protein [Pontibacter sp. G13]WNJ18178.1 hypothetical protein RJD25_25285 [Pontibacter sp. G13]